MSNLLDDIQVKVAALSAEERAALALRLIESLDAEYPTQTEDWESTWLAECDRRVYNEKNEIVGFEILHVASRVPAANLRQLQFEVA